MKTIKISIIYFFIIWVCSCNQKTKEGVFSKRINNYLIACETNGFSGSLLISKKHNIIFNKGYGLANKEKEIQTLMDLHDNLKKEVEDVNESYSKIIDDTTKEIDDFVDKINADSSVQ